MNDDLCQCPKCGRMHRHLGFGKPPEAISGQSLLKRAELLGPVSPICDLIARALFGPPNSVWDKRWNELHDGGLTFQSWAGNEPTEGKSFYRGQAQIALQTIKDRIDTRLNNHLVDMRPGYDDSIVGFNDAWDIVRAVFAKAEGR